jgi:hypothetical protein
MKVLTEQDEQALRLVVEALSKINALADMPTKRGWQIRQIAQDAARLARNVLKIGGV